MRTELIESMDRWACLRDEWDRLVARSTFPSVFLTFDYLSIAFATFHAADSELFLIVVRDEDARLLGVAPLRRSRRSNHGIAVRVLEYVTTWEIDKPYCIFRSGFERECWDQIHRFLDCHPGDWDVLELVEMSDETQGVTTIPELFGPPRYRCGVTPGPDGPIVDLTIGWAQFLAAHPKYSRALKRLNRLPGGYAIRTYDSRETIDVGIASYVQIESLSWKHARHGLGKNRWHADFYRRILDALSGQGRVAIRILASGDELVAGIICCEFEETVYVHHTVYDPRFAHYSPGTMFMGLVLGEYMKSGRCRSADLLCGFADFYKPWAKRIVSTSHVRVTRIGTRMRIVSWLEWLGRAVRTALPRRIASAD